MAGSNLGRLLLYLGSLIAVGSSTTAHALAKTLETEVKAAFLSKFAAYVNWPPGAFEAAERPIKLCVIGRDSLGTALDQAVTGQYVDLHPITVVRLEGTSVAGQCHIAFLGGSAKQSTAAMQQALLNQPILTVTDARLGEARGIVHFALREGRVRFYIDDAMAARAKLAINARLLSLAISVKPRARAS